ncbi:MAG: glycosyltransferase WbuB [Bacteroidetes bacterium]|nr:MAG: glycosyltransferase WbuB [Bacteroidota bacterium]
MTIVYFYQYFGTAKGGWSTRVYEMTRRWVQQGHRVVVVTSPYDKSDIPKGKGLSYRTNIEGIEVIVLNFKQTNKVSKLKRMLGFAQYLTLAIYYALTLKFDVAVCSSGPITVGYMGLAARFFRGKKFVFEVRDLWPAGAIQLGVLKQGWFAKWAWWFEKRCYKRAHLIVAASQGMKNDIVKRFGFDHVIVVPNASDNELFGDAKPIQLPPELEGKDLIMYTGSLGRIDHCMEIMEAARLLDVQKFPQAHILFIGDGADRGEMEAYKAKHHLHHVTLLGLMPKTELAQWLKHALASILTIKNIPMLHTCSPNKIFDAFAASKPIIQTTTGWIKDFTEAEQCGLNVAPENPAALAQAFEYYLANKDVAIAHGKNAKRLAETIFSRDYCANTMLNAIVNLKQTQG